MSDEAEQGPEGSGEIRVACGDSLDISIAGELRGRLGEALTAGGPVVLEASAIERADAAALQLLCAFFNEAGERGVAVRWEAPSEALLDAARLIDLAACLQLVAD